MNRSGSLNDKVPGELAESDKENLLITSTAFLSAIQTSTGIVQLMETRENILTGLKAKLLNHRTR